MHKLLIGAVVALSMVATSVPATAAVQVTPTPIEHQFNVELAPVQTAFWLEVCIGLALGILCDIIWAPNDDDPDMMRIVVPDEEPEPKGRGRSEEGRSRR